MTDEYYHNEARRLREVLADALERGDYHLEMDVKEALQNLRDKYYEDDQN